MIRRSPETRYSETPYPTPLPHGRSSLLGPSWAVGGGEAVDLGGGKAVDLLVERYGNGVINTL